MARTWIELHREIPYVEGHEPVECRTITNGVGWITTITQPGHHALETRGGDFRVDITSHKGGWQAHPFTHHDLLSDIESKGQGPEDPGTVLLSRMLVRVVRDDQTSRLTTTEMNSLVTRPGIHVAALSSATQLLSIAEHRRYARYEPESGRYLPVRLALGVLLTGWPVPNHDRLKTGRKMLFEYRARYGREFSFDEVLATVP